MSYPRLPSFPVIDYPVYPISSYIQTVSTYTMNRFPVKLVKVEKAFR